MGMNNRRSVDPRWTAHTARPLEGFLSVVIQLIDPNRNAPRPGAYNPVLNNASDTAILAWEGPGQMQVFRQTLNAEQPAGGITQIRSLRFTVPINGPQIPVRKGMLIRVIDCPNDDDATRYQYTVTSGINSGLAFMRTIEAESDMSTILPPYNPATDPFKVGGP